MHIYKFTRGVLARAVSEHAWSLRLWQVFVRYCQETGSDRLVSRVLTKALRYHGECAGLWLHAASLEHNKNVRSFTPCCIPNSSSDNTFEAKHESCEKYFAKRAA